VDAADSRRNGRTTSGRRVSAPAAVDQSERAVAGGNLPDLETLIRLKRAAGRPKDLERIAELEALRSEQHRDDV
jgi:hypothetical protein